MTEPKRGMRFLHAKQRVRVDRKPVREWPHMECEVTKVTATAVYFRNTTGFRSVVSRDRFAEAVREVLD